MDANKELLYLYFRIGKMIYENQKYGTDFINTLSTSLKLEFKDASGFSPRNLSRMKKFYETYKDMPNLPTPLAKFVEYKIQFKLFHNLWNNFFRMLNLCPKLVRK